MANKDDYLTYYREFFENFAETVNPNDQLPVKLASYKLINVEVIGGIIDWTTQYLTQKKCPQSLIAPLIQIVIDETRKCCKKEPTACGFNPSDNAYEPLKLMQTVMAKTNEVCLRYLDNSMLCSLPSPGQPHNVVSVCAAKNKRRKMEDRHVVVHDLNTMFNIQEASPSSYYAIFDGHAGHDAAAYSAAHLHQFLAESKHFVADPEQALRDAFYKTDALFIEKCNVERFNSGTTAVCALLRPKVNTLYIAWVGDSQALLVNQGRVLQCVNPHKPCRVDERERIEKQGGYVCYWGTWRVNGQLAVSRAIGDAEYKPYVIAVPDIREIPLDGGEDFLILACDGLWDYLSEDDAARTVYNMVCQRPDKTDAIGEHLVYLAKERGSADNISVIVVFLREPSKIAAEAHWANRNASSPISAATTMDTSLDNANNPFANSNGADNNIAAQKTTTDGLLLNLTESFNKHNGGAVAAGDFYHNNEKANGKRSASEFDDDDEDDDDDMDDEDLGPETDVDAVDDALPSIAQAKALADGVVNNNPDALEEKAALETDLDLQMQQSSEFDGQRLAREETPTPPADAVHDGGLEDNVADSGEESEDEWNYIKGEEANKENISPSQPDCEVADLLEEPDNMSQLNPNAAEFVPVSPTRSIPSPACRGVLNDPVIAQSPKRPSDIDISVPNPQEFENEVKSRPSDFDSYSNGHDEEGDQQQKPTSQELLMESLLNGKNIDEIPEFQPGSTPTKVPSSDEFHFGPNAAPFTPVAKPLDQSEAALSTRAEYGDESAALVFDSTLETSASKDDVDFLVKHQKEDDPMSMSLYLEQVEHQQEEERKIGEDTEAESFDLNKVQMLPDNLDEFLSKTDDHGHDVTISNEPEKPHQEVSDEILLNNDERIIQTTDLDKMVDEEKELASPVSNEDDVSRSPNPPEEEEAPIDHLECDLPKEVASSPSPQPLEKPVEEEKEEVCSRPESKSPKPVEEDVAKVSSPEPELQEVAPSPQPQMSSPEPETKVLSPEPEVEVVAEEVQVASPEPPQVLSPEPSEELLCQISSKSPEPQAPSPQPTGDVCMLSKTPEPAVDEGVCLLPSKTPEPEQVQVEEVCLLSAAKTPEPEKVESPQPATGGDVCFLSKSPEPEKAVSPQPVAEDVCVLSKTPELEEKAPSPQPTVAVAAEEDVCVLAAKSPEPEKIVSPEPEQSIEEIVAETEEVEEQQKETSVESPIEDVTSSVKDVASPPVQSPLPDEQLSFAQEVNAAVVQETVTTAEATSTINEDETLVAETCPISTPKSIADTESVLTSEMNSFLERSQISELASPLSPGDQPLYKDGALNLDHPLSRCVYPLPTEIKTETIAPEFPEPALLSPAEQPKEETPTSPPEEEEEKTVKEAAAEAAPAVEEKVVAPAEEAVAVTAGVGAVAAVAGAAAVAAAASTAAEKKPAHKAKTPTAAAKKAPVKSSPTKAAPSPTKTRATPTTTASAATKTRVSTVGSKTTKTPTSTKSTTLSKPAPKPKTTTAAAATAPAPKTTDKKPAMSNGAAAPKTTLAARKSSEMTKTPTSPRPISKTSPTKPTAQRPSTAPAARPTATKTTTSTTVSSTTAAPKARPSTLMKSSTAAKTTTTTSFLKVTASKTTTSPKPTSPPKPRPTTAPAKPRVPLTKTVTKTASADAEKQSKDSANKLTASRTATARSTATSRTVTSTVKKTEAKATGSARTTLTKTTTTTTTRPTATGAGKKPAEITRTINKTKTTKVEKPIQNGVSTVVTEQITLVNNAVNESDQQLIKDNSPIDNKLIVETNTAD